MTPAIVQFLLAVVVIVFAGTFLTRCADVIAERTGLGRLLVGGIFLAAATSLPELAVDIHAVRLGLPDMAVGDLLGSCLFNLLILAIIDLSQRSRGGMLSRMAAAHALSGVNSIAMAAVLGLFLVFETGVHSGGIYGVSIGSWALLGAFLLGVRLTFIDQRAAAREAGVATPAAELPPRQLSFRNAILGFLASSAAILLAAPFLAQAAGRIAELSGFGGTFVGTALVAFSTSLPELVATTAAARMSAFDLAIGNVFGSNTFNLLMVFPLDIVHSGPMLPGLAAAHLLTCFAVVLVSSIVILGQLYRAEKRVMFMEPDATLVIVLVFVTLWLVFLAG